jgi:hypothetical protein
VQKKKLTDSDGKKVEKIIWLFKDNTFREYLPE